MKHRIQFLRRRREFIAILGGAAAAWPLSARAQQERERVRRVGILLPASSDDLDYQGWVGAFLQGLGQSGWTIGRNLRIDTRWATTNPASLRKHATELAASAPDVVLAHGVSGSSAMLQATRTIPIVFPVVGDPIGGGMVDSLARPGGNITGFMTFEYSMGGKWLELLKQIVPDLKRAAVLRDPAIATGIAHFGVIQAMAPSLGVEVSPVNLRDAAEIERTLTAFAQTPNGGAIMTPSGSASVHRVDPEGCGALQAARDLVRAKLRHRRRADLLWAGFHQPVPARGRLRRSHPQGREARGPAGAGADHVRAGDQP
jgi:putative ABC transport system substrate-binding protein